MKTIRKINVVGKFSWAFIIPKKFIKELSLKRDDKLTCELDKKRKRLILKKAN
jgi:antitoxin component of MazEF toxin-antitoxin module